MIKLLLHSVNNSFNKLKLLLILLLFLSSMNKINSAVFSLDNKLIPAFLNPESEQYDLIESSLDTIQGISEGLGITCDTILAAYEGMPEFAAPECFEAAEAATEIATDAIAIIKDTILELNENMGPALTNALYMKKNKCSAKKGLPNTTYISLWFLASLATLTPELIPDSQDFFTDLDLLLAEIGTLGIYSLNKLVNMSLAGRLKVFAARIEEVGEIEDIAPDLLESTAEYTEEVTSSLNESLGKFITKLVPLTPYLEYAYICKQYPGTLKLCKPIIKTICKDS